MYLDSEVSMRIETQLLKGLVYALESFATWMTENPAHKALIGKTGKRTRKQITDVEDIIDLAQKLIEDIPVFAAKIATDPQKNKRAIAEFKEKGEELYQKVNKVIKRHDKMVTDLTPVLTNLLDTLKNAFHTMNMALKETSTQKTGLMQGHHRKKNLRNSGFHPHQNATKSVQHSLKVNPGGKGR